MVDANFEEDKPHQTPSQQRTTAPEVFNRNVVVKKCDMGPDIDHAIKGTKCRIAEGFKPVHTDPLQLPASPYRGVYFMRGYDTRKRSGL